MAQHRRMVLWAIVTVAIGLRLGLALVRAPDFVPILDEGAYHALALGVLDGQGFSSPLWLGPIAVPGQPTSVWNCGQPLYLALVYALFGPKPIAVFVLNALLGGVLVWLTYRLASNVFSKSVVFGRASGNKVSTGALVAAGILAVDPYANHFSASLYTEPLYMVLFTAALVLLLPDRPQITSRQAALAGLWIGLAALIRSTALYALPFLLVALLWRIGRRAIQPAVCTVLVAAATIAPWVVRNVKVHQAFVLLDTKAGWNLYYNYHPQADDPPLVHGIPDIAPPPGYHRLREIDRDRLLGQEGWKFIREAPLRAAKRAAGHLVDFWWPLATEETGPGRGWIKAAFLIPLELLALWGAWRAWPARRRLSVLYLLVAYYCLLHSFMIGAPRYRLALDPVLAIFAAAVLSRRTPGNDAIEPA